MKKVVIIIILLIIIIGIIVGISYFNSNENQNLASNNGVTQETTQNIVNNDTVENIADETINENSTNNNTISIGETQDSQEEGEEESMENARIRLTVNGNEIFVRLDDNVASRELLEMLPLTLTFEDFNNTEKIATLPSELSTEGLPSGYTPEVGDFSYYAPWGNLSIFYEDFRYSSSLYKLGTIESGTEILGNMNGNFEVIIERVN